MAYFPGEVDGSIHVMLMSALGWLFFHQSCILLLHRVSYLKIFDAPRIPEAALLVCSFLFSVYVTISASFILSDPDQSIISDVIYGFSPRAQHLIAFSSGFFLWNLVSDHSTASHIAHHLACLFVYAFALYPTFHLMALICLLWEASTPLLCVRSMLILMDKNNTRLFGVVNKLFAVVFFLVRIMLGIPSSVIWWIRVMPRVFGDAAGMVSLHSPAVIYTYLLGNIILNGLNVVWMLAFLKRYFSKKHKESRHNTEGISVTKVD